MHEIPVEFDYEGKHYKGILTEVFGAGSLASTKWHLMINKYYFGSVLYTESYGIRFVSNVWKDDSLNDVFEMYVISWYQ